MAYRHTGYTTRTWPHTEVHYLRELPSQYRLTRLEITKSELPWLEYQFLIWKPMVEDCSCVLSPRSGMIYMYQAGYMYLPRTPGLQTSFQISTMIALLDFVSRAHEIKIWPSSVVHRPSVRRPCRNYHGNCSTHFFQMLVPGCRNAKLVHFPIVHFFSVSLNMDPIWEKSKRHSCLKSLFNELSCQLVFWHFEFPIFKDIFFWKFHVHHCNVIGKQKNCNYPKI